MLFVLLKAFLEASDKFLGDRINKFLEASDNIGPASDSIRISLWWILHTHITNGLIKHFSK
jgi:hypothetical protein